MTVTKNLLVQASSTISSLDALLGTKEVVKEEVSPVAKYVNGSWSMGCIASGLSLFCVTQKGHSSTMCQDLAKRSTLSSWIEFHQQQMCSCDQRLVPTCIQVQGRFGCRTQMHTPCSLCDCCRLSSACLFSQRRRLLNPSIDPPHNLLIAERGLTPKPCKIPEPSPGITTCAETRMSCS